MYLNLYLYMQDSGFDGKDEDASDDKLQHHGVVTICKLSTELPANIKNSRGPKENTCQSVIVTLNSRWNCNKRHSNSVWWLKIQTNQNGVSIGFCQTFNAAAELIQSAAKRSRNYLIIHLLVTESASFLQVLSVRWLKALAYDPLPLVLFLHSARRFERKSLLACNSNERDSDRIKVKSQDSKKPTSFLFWQLSKCVPRFRC